LSPPAIRKATKTGHKLASVISKGKFLKPASTKNSFLKMTENHIVILMRPFKAFQAISRIRITTIPESTWHFCKAKKF
jgi:hypothetical protein